MTDPIDTSSEGIADLISIYLPCDCDAPSECHDDDCALAFKVCRTLRTLMAERDQAEETLEGLIADIPEAWHRIQDVALQVHKDGGRELAQLVFQFQATLRALAAERDQLRATLEQIAGQRRSTDMVDQDEFDQVYWRVSYDAAVDKARAAVAMRGPAR